jgi:hypothetical protein
MLSKQLLIFAALKFNGDKFGDGAIQKGFQPEFSEGSHLRELRYFTSFSLTKTSFSNSPIHRLPHPVIDR